MSQGAQRLAQWQPHYLLKSVGGWFPEWWFRQKPFWCYKSLYTKQASSFESVTDAARDRGSQTWSCKWKTKRLFQLESFNRGIWPRYGHDIEMITEIYKPSRHMVQTRPQLHPQRRDAAGNWCRQTLISHTSDQYAEWSSFYQSSAVSRFHTADYFLNDEMQWATEAIKS